MNRMINFSAGPTGLPLEVLKKAQDELLSYHNEGYSIMEISHRSKTFDEVYLGAVSLVKELYNLSDDFEVLFLQGGASLQFAMIPLNLYNGGVAEYVDTGVWSSKAIKEAKILNINHSVIASSQEQKYNQIPQDINFSDSADYAYMCSNNTIYGTQFNQLPKSKAPLVIDASSDFFSKELDFSNIGVLYGGAQKNAGASGVTIVIIRKDLLNRVKDNVPSMLRYKTHADSQSMFNTPPTFSIYILKLVMEWIKKQGGLAQIHKNNQQKAQLLYDAIDNSNGFYKGYAKKESRSLMNVSFNLSKGEDLEKLFVSKSVEANMLGLKGHRHLGGIRASLYNAVSLDDVKALVEFMNNFRAEFN